jgi:drug/metabolite transporter (DMT)-like permease
LGHGLVILFAVCAAVCMAVGIVVRQRATMDVPSDEGVGVVMLRTLLRRPMWWAGTAAAVAGFVFQALALVKGSLIVVQPLLVSALLFTLPLSARLAGRRVTRREWLWAGLLTVALALFVLVAHPGPRGQWATFPVTAAVAGVCGAVITGCVLLGRRSRSAR